ncbi:type I polyketide synthase [Oceaniovalibus sp. ACAM 378]|uniref:type I polyketide synthase n=1 Tax=Oceaniovalibus sp. ACAM 378 TaxID=2599923 RepID=UPI0011D5B5AB|nr:type I polyketide synthase [Oceaniovalibus sp. ACAM 378]TYB85035.1 type I polyketide synthase [Oceaniovalibus sp. ACAM 378]
MSNKPGTDYHGLLQRSVATINRLENELIRLRNARSEPVAIVGIGCRFPGSANTPEALWELLKQGRDVVTEVPPHRWELDPIYDPDPDAAGKTYSRWGAFLDDVEGFDPAFFGITPREAISLDPQQRLLLEVTWEALEHAGIAPSSLSGSQTAIFVGMTAHDFAMRLAKFQADRTADAYAASGSTHSIAAGRLSYFLGVHGPNFALDTACSSSMVAVHEAVRALRSGDADMALAGGVTLTLTPVGAILTSRARMMSFTGKCHTFDAAADGYVRGEGCAMIALKRLGDAQRDGDRIIAVIKGSAINQDGRSTGVTAPNGRAQVAVLRAALKDAGLEPSDISYVEAHGTGTSLGDPIEINALGEVFGDRPHETPLLVGSLKTNIGHTEGAAGIAGIIKAALALQHRQIPAHLHFETPNPLISWDTLPIHIPVRLTPWEAPESGKLRAGASSFGFSGTNAHIILEEAPPPPEHLPLVERACTLLPLTGRSDKALAALAGQLASHLRATPNASIAATAAELGLGRSHLNRRVACVVTNRDDALAKLDAVAQGETPIGVVRGSVPGGSAPEVVMMFTGQGSQYPGMTRDLYQTEPVFRAALETCAATLEGQLEHKLIDVMFDKNPAMLNDTAYTQPALFAVEWALFKLWQSWGVEPAAVVGHSIGEYVAACVAGVFGLEDALRLIAARGSLMSALPRDGTMAAIFADAKTVSTALKDLEATCGIAAMNTPSNTVISGRRDTVATVMERLAKAGISGQELTVSHAFHSPLMDPILESFAEIASGIRFENPQIALVSNLNGQIAGPEIATPDYWTRHISQPVRFADSVATLLQTGFQSFLEVGPSASLIGMARQCDGAEKAHWVGSLRKGRNDSAAITEAAATLYVQGQPMNWDALQGGKLPASRIALPTYPFQRERYWPEFDDIPAQVRASGDHPLLGKSNPGPVQVFQSDIGTTTVPWLADHRIYGHAPFPAAGFIEMAFGAAKEALGTASVSLRDIEIRDGLILPEDGSVAMQVILNNEGAARRDIRIYSAQPAVDSAEPNWRLHMQAGLTEASLPHSEVSLPDVPQTASHLDAEHFYGWMASLGVEYGPAFRPLSEIRCHGDEAWARVCLPDSLSDSGFIAHPSLIDGCAQLLGALLFETEESGDAFMPVAIDECRVLAPVPRETLCHLTQRKTAKADELECDFSLFDTDGRLVLSARGFRFQRVKRSTLRRMMGAQDRSDWLFDLTWKSAPLSEPQPESAVGKWLILADETGTAEQLVQRLRAAGAEVCIARQGNTFTAGDDEVQLCGGDISQVRRLLDEIGAVRDIVNLWPLDATGHDDLLATALCLAQGAPDGARLWFVTRGSQSIAGEAPNLDQSPVNAFAGVVATERPETHCVRIDLDPTLSDGEADQLFRALTNPDREDQTAFRGDARFAARLAPGRIEPVAQQTPVLLDITERGVLENLKFVPVERVPPGSGQIELRVRATGVNFRDVLNTLGMYPGDPGPLGSECAGVVTAVGPGVTEFVIGTEVVAMTDRSFATFVTVDTTLVVAKPKHLTMAEAAAVPVAWLTAGYALKTLGKVKPGDKVLIHAITGGVGMAAAQIAHSLGARVFGTAGSPEKRALAIRLGAEAVGDSRSLSFVQDLMAATDDTGVDFILNSLAGEFIPASLGMLAERGRFVEIGKTDEWDQARIDKDYPGRIYHQLYLGEITASDSGLVRNMLQDIYDAMAEGTLTPMSHRAWPLEQAADAFRFMAQGHHTGKIVLTQTRPEGIRADASYLITGGLRGIGLRTAQWLVASGARNLILISRSGETEPFVPEIEALRTADVTVLTRAVDVADHGAMADLLTEAEAKLPPLRGIIHAAGILDDAMIPDMTPRRIAKVLAPKVNGARVLHALTAKQNLDFFVVFGSGAGLMGAAGQSNYAAANGFLDAFAHWRRAQGLHALSIDWGSWAEIGMAAHVDDRHQKRWASMGLKMIHPDEGVEMLADALFGSPSPQVGIVPMIRSKLPAEAGPLFSDILKQTAQASTDTDGDILAQLTSVGADEHLKLLGDWLAGQIVRVLALEPGMIDQRDRPLMDLGMDSLMAMELHNRLRAGLGKTVQVSDLLKGPTVNDLTGILLAELDGTKIDEGQWEEAEI